MDGTRMGKSLSILIVDDDEALLRMLKESCSLNGYACATFTRADEALRELEQNPSSVLLTDIVMPGLKGLDLTRKVKHRHPEMIIIVMTGFIADFSYDEVIKAGATDFIKKPFTSQELMMRIEHAKMQERLRELSFTDELTGLPNRRGFFAFAQQQIKIAGRTKGTMALLFADLDDFKAINDTWGHLEGDLVLVDAAKIFQETFRESDIIARMSGDEFALLLVAAHEDGLKALDRRLQQRLDAYNVRRESSRRLSISMGAALYDAAAPRTLDDLLQEADARMYEQKQRKKSTGSA